MSLILHPVVGVTRGMPERERIAEINRVMADEGMFMGQFHVMQLKGERFLIEAWRHLRDPIRNPLGIVKQLRP